MDITNFKAQADEAIEYTKEGLDLLVELRELQEAINFLPINENFEQMLKEIIEKEKIAVGLIQKSNLIQKVFNYKSTRSYGKTSKQITLNK